MSSRSSGASRQSKWLIIGALVVAVLMGVGRLGAGLIDQSGSDPAPEPDCAAAVNWDAAADHTGDRVTVRGPVAGATYAENVDGQPTFLNLGRDHPDPERFTVVIWDDVRGDFDQPPETRFTGREVCVAGEVQMHEGSPQIELAGREAIRVADEQ